MKPAAACSPSLQRAHSRKRQRVVFSEDELRRSFEKFDSDGTGSITQDEFVAAVVGLDIDVSETEARRVFAWLDPKLLGFITFSQFEDAMQHNTFFRMVVKGVQQTVNVDVPPEYDWREATYTAYKHPEYVVENEYGTGSVKAYDGAVHGGLCGVYSDERRR